MARKSNYGWDPQHPPGTLKKGRGRRPLPVVGQIYYRQPPPGTTKRQLDDLVACVVGYEECTIHEDDLLMRLFRHPSPVLEVDAMMEDLNTGAFRRKRFSLPETLVRANDHRTFIAVMHRMGHATTSDDFREWIARLFPT